MPADRTRLPFQRVWQGRELLQPGKNLGISKAGEARKPKKEEGKRRQKNGRQKTEGKKTEGKKMEGKNIPWRGKTKVPNLFLVPDGINAPRRNRFRGSRKTKGNWEKHPPAVCAGPPGGPCSSPPRFPVRGRGCGAAGGVPPLRGAAGDRPRGASPLRGRLGTRPWGASPLKKPPGGLPGGLELRELDYTRI